MNAVVGVQHEAMTALADRYVRSGGLLPTHRAGRFDRERLPEPLEHLASIGLEPRERRGLWRTFCCPKHNGWSLRIHTATGAWACMAGCGSGGDLISFEMWRTGDTFIDVAKRLGAWTDDRRGPLVPVDRRPAGLSAADALTLLEFDATTIAVEAARAARLGRVETAVRDAILKAAGRILAVIRGRRTAGGASHA